jgi:hypothetical protein
MRTDSGNGKITMTPVHRMCEAENDSLWMKNKDKSQEMGSYCGIKR